MAKGEFISLLDHDDLLHASALFEVINALNVNNEIDFIYTDEDKINEKKQHIDPFIKPDWNQEFLFSVNYITHFATIRKSLISKVGGERGLYNGAQDWDLFLRTTKETKAEKIYHIPKILYSWRVHDKSTAKNLDAKPYIFDAQKNLLEDFFRSSGLNEEEFTVKPNGLLNGAWDVAYKGQKTENMHKAGEAVNFDHYKGH
jgi:glycosyltransferase involved in cell wall biosynthesis